jgi:hypothetical protein
VGAEVGWEFMALTDDGGFEQDPCGSGKTGPAGVSCVAGRASALCSSSWMGWARPCGDPRPCGRAEPGGGALSPSSGNGSSSRWQLDRKRVQASCFMGWLSLQRTQMGFPMEASGLWPAARETLMGSGWDQSWVPRPASVFNRSILFRRPSHSPGISQALTVLSVGSSAPHEDEGDLERKLLSLLPPPMGLPLVLVGVACDLRGMAMELGLLRTLRVMVAVEPHGNCVRSLRL